MAVALAALAAALGLHAILVPFAARLWALPTAAGLAAVDACHFISELETVAAPQYTAVRAHCGELIKCGMVFLVHWDMPFLLALPIAMAVIVLAAIPALHAIPGAAGIDILIIIAATALALAIKAGLDYNLGPCYVMDGCQTSTADE